MADLHFKGLSVDQMIAMGDAIAVTKNWDVAGGIYRHAIEQPVTVNQRRKLLNRLGILKAPKLGSYNLLKNLIALEADYADLFASEGLITWLKASPFYDDAKFSRLADKHSGLLPIANWHWNLQTHAWAVGHALPLDGELVELGVFKGHSTLFTAEYLDFAEQPRTFYLYDTFDGIPEDQLDPGWAENNKRTYQGQFTFEEVRDRFAHIPNIKVIKGRVPEILAEVSPEKISFIHMDLNNAAAEIAALDVLFDRIVPGGVILFDDYCWAVSRAQKTAEDAWFADRGLKILPLPTGQGLFFKT